MVFSQKPVSRYGELKHQAVDCILLMQVDAFMRVMDSDASGVAGVERDVEGPVAPGGFPRTGRHIHIKAGV